MCIITLNPQMLTVSHECEEIHPVLHLVSGHRDAGHQDSS